MDAELDTLAKLEAASRKLGSLDLYSMYRDPVLAPYIVSLQRKGLWFIASATQGNITEKGCELLRAERERSNHQAVVDALTEDAKALGLSVELVGTLGGKDEAFDVRTPHGGLFTLPRAELALFLVEERLCKAGKIR